MLMYDVIVIGFGKAGKTLAAKLSSQGKKVALIEKSKSMYGGTCINIACIPTKTLIVAAEKGLDFEEIVLGGGVSMASVRAITGRETAPQVFIGGKHIGGNDDLQKYFAESK